jgi:hypothetical protein
MATITIGRNPIDPGGRFSPGLAGKRAILASVTGLDAPYADAALAVTGRAA